MWENCSRGKGLRSLWGMRAGVFRKGRGLGAETFPAELTVWEKVRSIHCQGVCNAEASGPNEAWGWAPPPPTPHPPPLVLYGLSVTVVKVRFHGSLISYFSMSGAFFALTSAWAVLTFASHVPPSLILHNVLSRASPPSLPTLWPGLSAKQPMIGQLWLMCVLCLFPYGF